MKKLIFTFFTTIMTISVMAQTIGEAFYVYRNDGMINTFFRSDIDSITFSYYDVDSVLYDEIVSQVVYTPDSIYQIPLAIIDSVGFVTPETKYKPDVIRLEGVIRNYILGSDSLTVFFRSDTPSDILPKIGDKLVTTEMSEVFAGGFIGQVKEKEQNGDTIFINCDVIGIEEVFECFYYSTNEIPQNNPPKTRALEWEWNNYYTPGPFVFSYTSFLDANFEPIDCPWVLTPQLDVAIAPTFKSKGSIIVHPLRGVVISLDIKEHTSFTKDMAVSGEINAKRDFAPEILPMYPILPFVFIYGDVGFFIEANIKLALEEHLSQSLDYNIHYEASYLPMFPMPFPTSIPKFNITNVNLTTNHDQKFMADGYVAGGLYGEIGIVPLLTKHIAKVGFRFEGGIKLGGNAMIYNSDGKSGLISTSPYERLNARELYVKPFCRVGMTAKLIGVGNGEVNLFEHDWDLVRFKLVPDFSNTTLKRKPDTSSTLIAATTASGSTIVPCTLGFKLFEGEKETGIKGTSPYDYRSLYGYPELYYDTFESQSPTQKYTVYPTVNIFGLEMLATPSAELDTSLKPITLHVEDITDTTAKVWGKVEGHELLDETMTFGLGYEEVEGTDTVSHSASLIDENGNFSVEFINLKPGTTYNYFAYLTIDGETYSGEKKEFTTKEEVKREAYYVWDSSNKTATYYYDDKCISRGGETNLHLWSGRDHAVEKVIFDSSFSMYYPKSFGFHFYESLKSIDNLNYLNTDSLTSMQGMFNCCISLTNLDVKHFNTTNVTSMGYMFKDCSSLTNLDLSNFNTSNVTNMGRMFDGCSSLTSLDLSNFNTSNVTDMFQMFKGCGSLISLDVHNFDTENVTNMTNMFCGCSSLTSLDLTSFVVNIVIAGMFSNCGSLKTIYAGDWNAGDVYCSPNPFSGCPNLTGGQGTKVGQNLYGYDENGNPLYYYCDPRRTIYARIDGGKDKPGLFTAK